MNLQKITKTVLWMLLVTLSFAGITADARPKKVTTISEFYPDDQMRELSEDEEKAFAPFKDKFNRPQYFVPSEKYKAKWKTLQEKEIPQWMLDAKFGIYTHWGPYSVPAYQGNTYIEGMYDKQDHKGYHTYHKENYGDVSEYGYTKFIDDFKTEEFNGDEYVQLMIDTGAKFGGLGVVHHDGFLMWDSDIGPWNVGKNGPKRDIYGEFVAAAKKKNFKTLATFHHLRTYGFAMKHIDEGEYSAEEKANIDMFQEEYGSFFCNPEYYSHEQFIQDWNDRIVEVMDKYKPDAIWFDGLGISKSEQVEGLAVDFLNHYYEVGEKNGQEIALFSKLPGAGKKDNTCTFNFPEGVGMRCYENGRNMPPDNGGWFLTDRAVSYPWSYVKNKNYNLKADHHIRAFADLVAKGGIFLMSLTPMASGEIAEEELEICRGIGAWLKVNGEAIYNTRPWEIAAEGPIKLGYKYVQKRQGFWSEYNKFSPEEMRFTQSKDGKSVYVMSLGWPESGKMVVKNMKLGSKHYDKKVNSVKMLGSEEAIRFSQTEEGLEIYFPNEKPCEYVYSFKVM